MRHGFRLREAAKRTLDPNCRANATRADPIPGGSVWRWDDRDWLLANPSGGRRWGLLLRAWAQSGMRSGGAARAAAPGSRPAHRPGVDSADADAGGDRPRQDGPLSAPGRAHASHVRGHARLTSGGDAGEPDGARAAGAARAARSGGATLPPAGRSRGRRSPRNPPHPRRDRPRRPPR